MLGCALLLTLACVLLEQPVWSSPAAGLEGQVDQSQLESHGRSAQRVKTARMLLYKHGWHFPGGDCDKATTMLQAHFRYADAPLPGQYVDGRSSDRDFRVMHKFGRAALRVLVTRANYFKIHHGTTMKVAVDHVWKDDLVMHKRVEMGRMTRYFFVLNTQKVTPEFDALETAKHHNAEDGKISWGDTTHYRHQDTCLKP